jgi:hypothetical protein
VPGGGPRPEVPVTLRPRRTIAIFSVVWGVVLAVGALWAIGNGRPTAREQTTVADAQPAVDAAVARIATAAGGDGDAVVAISGFELVGDCRVTVVRPGVRYQRSVTVIVAPGTEDALLDRVAARLPASYQVSVRHDVTPRLAGDGGLYVRLTGGVVAAGLVRFVADTGDCRPPGTIKATDVDAMSVDQSKLIAAFDRLRVPVRRWNGYRVGCPGGGSMTTIEAVGADGAPPGPLDQALRGLVGTPAVATANLFGYADGGVGVAVRSVGGPVVATATTPCR